MSRTLTWMLPLLVACGGQAAPHAAPTDGPGASLGMGFGAERAASGEDITLQAEMADDGAPQAAAAVSPKLIKTGSVSVAVEAFEPFERDLRTWLSGHGGYIAESNLTHSEGDVSWASLELRVPAEDFDTLVHWAEERVRVEGLSVHAQDVTAEWVDVEARLDNHRRSEARLQALLAENTATLADVLQVERELSRVRGEIEAYEGRMRVLSDQVSLATLRLDVRVLQTYEPYVAPTFAEEATDAFAGSIEALGDTMRALTLLAVALTPWLAPPSLLILFGLWLTRTALRRRESLAR